MDKGILVAIMLGFVLLGCENSGSSSATLSIPATKPPVQTATPSLLIPSSASRPAKLAHAMASWALSDRDSGNCTTSGGLSEVDGFCLPNFKSRVFPDSGGPTALFDMLTEIDGRFAEIVTRSSSADTSCLDNTLVDHAFTPFGLASYATTFKFQCYENLTRDGYLLFGKDGETWYLVDRGGQGGRAISITPITGATDQYTVTAYMGVGYGNSTDSSTCSSSWDGCSYAAMALTANSQTKAMEFTFAGVGVGFCGIHLKTDGTHTYVLSSEEGVGTACETTADTACLLNSDFSSATASNCTSLDEDDFTLTSLGRKAASKTGGGTWQAATIPSGGANVDLNGETTDGIHFFPTAATDVTGLTQFGQSSSSAYLD